jgi:glucosamine--fructose-6-phosphate aminotransferase (isomerizing)
MSFLAEEIASQPDELASMLDRETERLRRFVAGLPPISFALVAARGSSDHAAEYARYAWAHAAGIPVAPAIPSLHTLYGTPPRLEGALVVAISQSGQSPDVAAVLEEGRRQGRPTLALTNDPGSPLARAADHVIQLCRTPERSVAATKTYTCELGALALFAALRSGDDQRLAALARMPEAMAATLAACDAPAVRVAEALREVAQLVCVGRGLNLCTAQELALKLRELLRVATIGFSAADFRHGSIALAADGLPVLLAMPSGLAHADMRALAGEVRARGARPVVISDATEAGEGADGLFLPMGGAAPEWLSPLTAVLPGQRLALAMVADRGLDPDRPRGLPEKIVRTV